MKCIVIKQSPNGTFDAIDLKHKRVYNQYNSPSDALNNADVQWAGVGCNLRFEFYRDQISDRHNSLPFFTTNKFVP